MSTGTVIVLDFIHKSGIELLGEHFRVLRFYESSERDEVAGKDAVGILVRTSPVSRSMINAMPKLEVIAKHGAGVDNIDLVAAKSRGILVGRTPGGLNALSVAEGAVALMFACYRKLADQQRLVVEGKFGERNSINLRLLHKKVLGLVGAGNIGQKTASICRQGFNMRVIAFDPYLSAARAAEWHLEKKDKLDDLLAESDIVSIHTPLTSETRGLIGKPQLQRMKRSSIIINTSRGGIIDEVALYEGLVSGQISAAGLDVFEVEPPDVKLPLFKLPNVAVTPHSAGVTDDSMQDMAIRAARIVIEKVVNRKDFEILE